MYLNFIRMILLGFTLFATQSLYANPKLQQAQTLLEQSKLQESLDMINEVLSEDAGNIEARFMKGLILTRYDRLPDAEVVFDQLTRDHPDLPEPYNNLAVVYAAQGKFDEARDALTRAINTHPSYATAHENLGDIYAKMASRAYNQALELDDGNSSAREKLSLVKEVFSATAYASVPAKQAEPEPEPVTVAKVEETTSSVETEPTNIQPPVVKPVVEEPAKIETVEKQTVETAPVQSIPLDPNIETVILDWANSWSAQSVEDYLSYYSNEYKPQFGISFEKWKQQRYVRLKQPKFIKIQVENIQIDMITEAMALASFKQAYTSDTYNDKVNKKLRLQKQKEQWKIVEEFSN